MKWDIHIYDPRTQETTTHVRDYPKTTRSDRSAVTLMAARDLRKPEKHLLATVHTEDGRQHSTVKRDIHYFYRGDVERGTGRGYRWHPGYSENSASGGVLYPWLTKREAQADAKARGGRAVFVDEQTKRQHSTMKKTPAQLTREINEALAGTSAIDTVHTLKMKDGRVITTTWHDTRAQANARIKGTMGRDPSKDRVLPGGVLGNFRAITWSY